MSVNNEKPVTTEYSELVTPTADRNESCCDRRSIFMTVIVISIIAFVAIVLLPLYLPCSSQQQHYNFNCTRPVHNCTLVQTILDEAPTSRCHDLFDTQLMPMNMSEAMNVTTPRQGAPLLICDDGALLQLYHDAYDGTGTQSYFLSMGFQNEDVPVLLYESYTSDTDPYYTSGVPAPDQHGFRSMHVTFDNFTDDPTYQRISQIFQAYYGGVDYFQVGWMNPQDPD